MAILQQNEFSKPSENNASLLKRFYLYQKERFPVLGHGLLIASFSFSAIAYSRICRGAAGFVSWKIYLTGIFITITLFLLVRIFDEFKDAADDAMYRRSLPVPRGLVSFRELMITGIVIVILQVVVNLFFFPKMLLTYCVIIAYLCLMGKEFFVSAWLVKHQFWYVVSHMFIIPLVDIYASGLDWLLAGVKPSAGLLLFFAVSYMNGVILEIGRKIRVPEKETAGVHTYTSMLGIRKAILLWILVLTVTLCLAIGASSFAGYGITATIILGTIFIICLVPACLFLRNKTEKGSKNIEYASAFWSVTMYLTLGAVPMLNKMLFN